MFGLYTKITTTSDKRKDLLDILLHASQAMQSVDGCMLYIINESATEPDVIWVTEIWNNKESHAASLQLESNKALIAQAMPLIAKPPEQILLTPVGGKGI